MGPESDRGTVQGKDECISVPAIRMVPRLIEGGRGDAINRISAMACHGRRIGATVTAPDSDVHSARQERRGGKKGGLVQLTSTNPESCPNTLTQHGASCSRFGIDR